MKTLEVSPGSLADLDKAVRAYLGPELAGRTDLRPADFHAGCAHSTWTKFGMTRLGVLWRLDGYASHYMPFPVHPLTVTGVPGGPRHFRFVDLADAVSLAREHAGPDTDDESICFDVENPGLPETAVLKCDRYVDPDAVTTKT